MEVDDDSEDEREAKRRKRLNKFGPEGAGGGAAEGFGPVPEAPPMSLTQAAMQQHQSAAAFNRLAAAAAARHNDAPRPRVYVGNLDPWVSEQEIMQIFSSFGIVAGIDMPREGNPPQSKGFCFVEFLEQKMADQAIGTLQDFMLGGRQLRVGRPTSQKRTTSSGAVPVAPVPLAALAGLGALGGGSPGATSSSPGAPQVPSSVPGASPKPLATPASATTAAAATSGKTPEAMSSAQLQAWREKNGCKAAERIKVLLLENLVAPGDADADLADEVREECGNFGTVEKVVVHEVGKRRVVRVFVRFVDPLAGGKARLTMNGRWFGGRQVKATSYGEESFAAKRYEEAVDGES